MKVLYIIIWLILGFFYWWMWGTNLNGGECCTGGKFSAESSSMIGVDGDQDTINTDLQNELEAGSEADGDTDDSGSQEDESDTGQDGQDEEAGETSEGGDGEPGDTEAGLSDAQIAEAAGGEAALDEVKIVEIEDRTRIHFPYNSTYKLASPEIEEYLDKVVERVNASGESIRLIGHTDSIGPDDYNMKLGRWRANVIRDFLISKGINPKQIRTSTMGESKPIASNINRQGRAQNRRVELIIE